MNLYGSELFRQNDMNKMELVYVTRIKLGKPNDGHSTVQLPGFYITFTLNKLIGRQPAMAMRIPATINLLLNDESIVVHIIFFGCLHVKLAMDSMVHRIN